MKNCMVSTRMHRLQIVQLLVSHASCKPSSQSNNECASAWWRLVDAGLLPSLQSPTATITVIVPTNAAFKALPPAKINLKDANAVQEVICMNATMLWPACFQYL